MNLLEGAAKDATDEFGDWVFVGRSWGWGSSSTLTAWCFLSFNLTLIGHRGASRQHLQARHA